MDDIKKTILGFTKNVAKTSNELLKTTKLNLNISSEEENLKSLYLEIGKKVHEIYAYGGSLGKFFDEKYAEIQKVEQNIQALREQLSIAKGVKVCPKCGRNVESGAEFCPKCGASLAGGMPAPEPAHVSAAEPEPEPPKPAGKTCPSCGAQNESGAKFCLSCGRIL